MRSQPEVANVLPEKGPGSVTEHSTRIDKTYTTQCVRTLTISEEVAGADAAVMGARDSLWTSGPETFAMCVSLLIDGRVAGHLGDAVGLKTLSIHVCVCPHFGM